MAKMTEEEHRKTLDSLWKTFGGSCAVFQGAVIQGNNKGAALARGECHDMLDLIQDRINDQFKLPR